MACGGCGGKARSVRNIIKGNVGFLIESMFDLSIDKCDATNTRIELCKCCKKNTWLFKTEYAKFVFEHGMDFIKHIDNLVELPELPKGKNDGRRKKIFCMVCKCFIPAKAREKDEACPLGKW